MRQRVFISHSGRDNQLAAALRKVLEDAGVDVMTTVDATAGSEWRKATQGAIRRVDAVLVLLSRQAVVSGSWIGYEMGVAEALGKPMIVLADDRLPRAELPTDITAWPVIPMDSAHPGRAAMEALAAISALQAA